MPGATSDFRFGVLLTAAWVLAFGGLQVCCTNTKEFSFQASDRLPPTDANSSTVAYSIEGPVPTASSRTLVGPSGAPASWLGSLNCANKCRRWSYCYAYNYNSTTQLCYLSDQGQYESFWTSGNGTADSDVSFVKLYHDICTWQSWSSWTSASGLTDARLCNAPANRSRVRQCVCPTDGAAVSGWCQAVKNKTETEGSFVGWCQWSEWSYGSSNSTTSPCDYQQSRSRSRNCMCPAKTAPQTIEPAGVENVTKVWNWCDWDGWSSWTGSRGWQYSSQINTEFARKRSRKCGCSGVSTSGAAGNVSDEIDRRYSAWCSWSYFSDWYRDCGSFGRVCRQRSRSTNCFLNYYVSNPETNSDDYSCNRDTSCRWSDWFKIYCGGSKGYKRVCDCGDANQWTWSVDDVKC